MPYQGQYASKTGHADLLKNPDVLKFLEGCAEVPRPSTTELIGALAAGSSFDTLMKGAPLPNWLFAIDGSSYESSPDRYPSRRIGYVKIATVGLNMDGYLSLSSSRRYIDPFLVNKLKDDTEAIGCALPGAYVIPGGAGTPFNGFRREVLNVISSPRTKLGDKTLYDTLLEILRFTSRYDGTVTPHVLRFNCPSCGVEIRLPVNQMTADCSDCGQTVYASDILRCHETFSSTDTNVQAYSRLMSALEHILLFHYMTYLFAQNPKLLSNAAFIVDGPLALFGEPASLHRGMMGLFDELRQKLSGMGLSEPLVVGLTKTGRLIEHLADVVSMLETCGSKLGWNPLEQGFVMPVSDEYRYKYIEPAKQATTNHGEDTYYGQDFLIFTPKGHIFVAGLPYPCGAKSVANFQTLKSVMENYHSLARCLRLISEFESDLFESSMVPVTLAHQHASISLTPGGKVLDILTKNSLKHTG